MGAKDDQIERQQAQLEAERQAAKAHANALHAQISMLESTQGARFRALAAHYGQYRDTNTPLLVELLSVLQLAVDVADPARGAPSEDTMRVDHTPSGLTSVEAAADSRSYRAKRALVRDLADQIDGLIERAYNDIGASRSPKGSDKPRCWRRDCEARGKRQTYGQPNCGWCGRPMRSEAA